MNGKPINVFEDGLESRDFVYIEDVVAATMLAIEHPKAGQGIFNVGSGEATDVNTVVQSLTKCFKPRSSRGCQWELSPGRHTP